MSDRVWCRQVRLALGLLLAPALVPVAYLAILLGLYGLGSENAGILLAMAWPDLLYIGLAISYGGALVAGAPWVAYILREGHLDLRSVMFLPMASVPPSAISRTEGMLSPSATPHSVRPQ